MKIIQSFGNSVGINSQAQKAPDFVAKKDKNLETKDAKTILTNTLAISAAAFFGWLAVDKIRMGRIAENGLKKIIPMISDDCTEYFQQVMKNFNDWQKVDFIKAFEAGREAAQDKTHFALEEITKIVNGVKGIKVLDKINIPENSIEGFEELLKFWSKK